mgnify:FL=1
MENNNLKNNKQIKRGQVYYFNLEPGVGSEQSGRRPCLILQNNTSNKFSPVVVVAVLTTKLDKHKLPTHVLLGEQSKMPRKSVVLLEQIMTIDRKRIGRYVTTLSDEDMLKVDRALKISLALK